MLKVMTIFGTRPEAIKMAPVVRELLKHEEIDTKVCLTAQHREMLDQVVDLFGLPVDYDLDIMKSGQSLYDITARVLRGLEDVLKKEKPDYVLVHGDTTTTFTAALAAFYQQIRIGHVEAGLRTGNLLSPFPEEANRQLTGVLANVNFAPTETARQNLLRENKSDDSIFVTGNTVIDALLTAVKKDYHFEDPEIEAIEEHKRVILVTTHRRENSAALWNPCRIRKSSSRFTGIRSYAKLFPKNSKEFRASISSTRWNMNHSQTSWRALPSSSPIPAESRKRRRASGNRSSSFETRPKDPKPSKPARSA